MVFGVNDKYPHKVVGTTQCDGAIGKLEQDIYNATKIRVTPTELFEGDKRVLVIHVPSRPAGKLYKFEDVPLMRVGEELLPMSDEQHLKIIQEQEPDFSERICEAIAIEDLDSQAILKMKEAYSKKQENELFLTLPDKQALTDLHLITNKGKVTYAALILLGKEEIIKKHLPQSSIYLEYRNDVGQIRFDDRHLFSKPYYLAIDELWYTINLRNSRVPVQEGPYIFDIPYFNKEVIREAINNAIAHRDYRRTSEVVLKQYPQALYIISPGGFPIGVSLKNLLTVSSTPRNRLLADVLAKTGIVERSGQGVDKIFYQSISEGKGAPDYSSSDDFQVHLALSAIVKDQAFAVFITKLQQERSEKLSVQEILFLDAVRQGISKDGLDKSVGEKLFNEGLIEKVGKTNRQQWRLSKSYYSFTNKEADYTKNTPIDDSFVTMRIVQYLKSFGKAKMGKFVELFEDHLTRDQVKTIIYRLSDKKVRYLDFSGNGTGREYFLAKTTVNTSRLMERAIQVGIEELRKRGELNLESLKTDKENDINAQK